MGVIRNPRKSIHSCVSSAEEQIDQVEILSEDSLPEDDIHDIAIPIAARRARSRRPARPVFGTKPRIGRRGRHYDETLHLMSLVDEEDYHREVDINDFMDTSRSSFSKFAEMNGDVKMLVNCTEEEQEHILGSLCEQTKKVDAAANKQYCQYDPQTAFDNIERSLRLALQRKHIPMGCLANLEQEVVNFFTQTPTSVYTSPVLSSYERLLLHGLCQYQHLRSFSYNSGDQRLIQVKNGQSQFTAMSPSLTDYIEERNRNKHL